MISRVESQIRAVGLIALISVSAWAEEEAGPHDLVLSEEKVLEDNDVILTDFSLEELLNITVTASRFEQSELEAPASITVITREEIRNSPARSIPDLLATVPGITVFTSAPGHHTVSIRGMNGLQANNVIVLLNGLRVNLGYSGEVDWSTLPVTLESLARIEVVRGPVSVLYGANAYTGVINLITHSPKEAVTSIDVAGNIDFDGRPGIVGSAHYGASFGVWSWQLGVVGAYDAMFNFEDATDDFPNDYYKKVGTMLVNRWDFNADNVLSLQTGVSYSENADFNNIVPTPNMQKAVIGHAGADFTSMNLIADEDALTIHGLFLFQNADDSVNRRENHFTLGTLASKEGEGEISYRFPTLLHNRPALGATFNLVHAENKYLMEDFDSRVVPAYGLYLSDEFKWLPVVLSGGVRFDFSPSTPTGKISYRASASYIWKNNAVRVSGGEAFRAPTYFEAGGRFHSTLSDGFELVLLEGNPELKPPEVTSLDLSYQGVFFEHLKLTPTVFYNHLSNLVFQDFEPITHKTYKNLGSRNIIGVELGVTYISSSRFFLRAAYTFQRFIKPPKDSTTTIGYPEANPEHTCSLTGYGKLFHERMTLSLTALYRSAHSYRLRVGVPPTIIIHHVDHAVSISPRIGFEIVKNLFELYTIGIFRVPDVYRESPYTNAAIQGHGVIVGARFGRRGE